jgi:beta-glucanase (GH16 family)
MDTVPTNFIAAQSKASAVFDPLAQSLQLHANTSGPARTVAKLSPQLYGQFEVSAKVSMHPGVITSIDVSDTQLFAEQGV